MGLSPALASPSHLPVCRRLHFHLVCILLYIFFSPNMVDIACEMLYNQIIGIMIISLPS